MKDYRLPADWQMVSVLVMVLRWQRMILGNPDLMSTTNAFVDAAVWGARTGFVRVVKNGAVTARKV